MSTSIKTVRAALERAGFAPDVDAIALSRVGDVIKATSARWRAPTSTLAGKILERSGVLEVARSPSGARAFVSVAALAALLVKLDANVDGARP